MPTKPRPPAAPEDLHEWLSFEDPTEDRTWTFDLTFLLSSWTCIYGRGCPGIDEDSAPELEIGCCTHGAYFTDDSDRDRVRAAVELLTADQWQLAGIGRRDGALVTDDDGSWMTAVHDGACIMLNRAGFPGGAGCALHRAALERGERPLDLKPDVCWQVPVRRVDSTDEVGHVTSTVREWKRRDWGEGGEDFHWWCIEEPEAFVGEATVLTTMADELAVLVGQEIYDLLVGAVAERQRTATLVAHPTVRRG
ncbi:MAG TPA: hypothetical protein VMN58_04935 [Acidimicrobiales bacterium]|nr:hypothetical protein [Acidimicrobiales bacterium]